MAWITPLVPDEIEKHFVARNQQRRSEQTSRKQTALYAKEKDQLDVLPPLCTEANRDELLQKWGNIDFIKLNTNTAAEFYSVDNIQALSCVAHILTAPQRSESPAIANLRLRETVTNLRVIGTPSANGIALRPDLRGVSNTLYIFKAPRNANDYGLIHEVFIAIFGTNQLRGELLNFSFGYGGFFCSPPAMDKQNKILTWCNSTSTGGVQYAMYENIFPSVSFGRAILNLSVTETYNLLMQIFLALDYAHQKLNFTHYDLHGENVLLRELGGDKLVPYPTRQGRVYIKTKYIPTFIDYGNSFVEINQQKYGNSFVVEYSETGEKSFPMADTLRIVGALTTALFRVQKRNASQVATLTFLIELYQLFYDRPVTPAMLRSDLRGYLGLPRRGNRDTITHAQFIAKMNDLVQQKFPNLNRNQFMFTTPPANFPVLECTNCQPFRQILNLDREIAINSSFEFMELYNLYTRQGLLNMRKQLVQFYQPGANATREFDNLSKRLLSLEQIVNYLKSVNFRNIQTNGSQINYYFEQLNWCYGLNQIMYQDTLIVMNIFRIYPRLLDNQTQGIVQQYLDRFNKSTKEYAQVVNMLLYYLKQYDDRTNQNILTMGIARLISSLRNRMGISNDRYSLIPKKITL